MANTPCPAMIALNLSGQPDWTAEDLHGNRIPALIIKVRCLLPYEHDGAHRNTFYTSTRLEWDR